MYRIIGADGKEYGPVSGAQLQQWQAQGRVNAQTKVRADDSSEWRTLADFPELSVAPAPGRTPPPSFQSFGAATPEVPNYLWQSIAVTLCCCLPFGVVAIIYAAQVKSKAAGGNLAGAQESSRKAKMWCWIGFGLGIITNLIAVILQLVAFNASSRGF